ncbi:uncharacterized protein LOC123551727 [Mercenaria mercenaria]|uniref:uncharacterized protein LOC123551727 n=1 Tax=Mercenaria mercenaria TaxID=6596 RepID=UPI00234FB152|nr:uncharacterized protein LOC123551727 [Mercenaria mercenaria]
MCLQNGKWDGTQPICIKNDLDDLKDTSQDEADSEEDTPKSTKPVFDKTEETSSNITTTLSSEISSKPSEKDENEASQALSISVPIVICVLAIVVIIAVLLWRQKRKRSASTVVYRNTHIDSSISGQTLGRQSPTRASDYAVIPPESVLNEEASGNEYQYIDILPEDKTKDSFSYDHIKQAESHTVDRNYSHLTESKRGEQSFNDHAYAHTGTGSEPKEWKRNSDEFDASYDILHIMGTPNAGQKSIGNVQNEKNKPDLEYNHGVAGRPASKNETDNYSHLNSSGQTPQSFTQNEGHRYNENVSGTKDPHVQPYQYGKEPLSQQYELDNPNSRSVKFDKECDGNHDDEKNDGTSHNYFILQPED